MVANEVEGLSTDSVEVRKTVRKARLRERETARKARLRERETARKARLRERETARKARLRERETARKARLRERKADMMFFIRVSLVGGHVSLFLTSFSRLVTLCYAQWS